MTTTHEAITQYVAFRQAAGADFRPTARLLSAFCRAVGARRAHCRDSSRTSPCVRRRPRTADAVLASKAVGVARILSVCRGASVGGARPAAFDDGRTTAGVCAVPLHP